MVGLIYKITSPTNRIYIGQTINFKKRMDKYKLLHCKSQTLIYNSLIKYGFKCHNVEIIEEVLVSELDIKEIFWIDYYKCNKNKYPEVDGLNLTDGGDGSRGRIPWNKGLKGCFSKEKCENHSKVMKGRKASEETKEKMSEIQKERHKKRPMTQETKEKMRQKAFIREAKKRNNK